MKGFVHPGVQCSNDLLIKGVVVPDEHANTLITVNLVNTMLKRKQNIENFSFHT